MTENRADSFLRMIRRSQRGRLKIYLGYAAGVGKTYQMLLDAHRLKEDGVDIVAGYVETHGRQETEALLSGLELIPRRKTTYRGIIIEEMDTDAIIARKPEVVLIDELAHTNVPNSKNGKRYQDVEEILLEGIHVVATLNIQHLESLYEIVEHLTGIKVRERVPDRLVAEADQLVNIDITTEDLRRRLQEGKVYTRDRVETALTHFFKPSNLEHLRELNLRELAAQIDSRHRDPLKEDLPSNPDQVMVALSSRGPNSEALLRYASRLAGRLNRNWYAVYVQTAKEHPTIIDATTQRILSNTLSLAQQLGATVFTYKGEDIVTTILQFAKEYRVGHIVIGTPGKSIPFWKRMMGKISLIERLAQESKDTTLVVLNTKSIPNKNVQLQQTDLPVETEPKVLVWTELLDKETAFRQLLMECIPKESRCFQTAWTSLCNRENRGSTFAGKEVVMPHAMIDGLKHITVAFGIAQQGLGISETESQIRIVIMLLSPDGLTDVHLSMLEKLGKMARDDQWRQGIGAAQTVQEVKMMIQSWYKNINPPIDDRPVDTIRK